MNSKMSSIIIGTCILMQGCFCGSVRTCATVSAHNYGNAISTKYRYRIKHVEHPHLKSESNPKEVLHDVGYGHGGRTEIDISAIDFKARYPNVFADSGMPVVIEVSRKGNRYENRWTVFLTVISVLLCPSLESVSFDHSVDLIMAGDVTTRDVFTLSKSMNSAISIFPTALLPYGDIPNCGINPVWGETDKAFGSDSGVQKAFSDFMLVNSGLLVDAFAYGVAAKLKELEDSGKIDAMLKKLEAAKPKVSRHRVVKFAREARSDFTYGFTLELDEVPENPEAAASVAMKEFGESVKEEYADSFPGVGKESLVVYYSDVSVNGKIIQGRATAIAIVLLSLSYDAASRRGKLSVRFNLGQAEEAREWIRKNIETLARDKNIAIVTGQPPPAATYYSLGEKIDGDVMEVEFKTE